MTTDIVLLDLVGDGDACVGRNNVIFINMNSILFKNIYKYGGNKFNDLAIECIFRYFAKVVISHETIHLVLRKLGTSSTSFDNIAGKIGL